MLSKNISNLYLIIKAIRLLWFVRLFFTVLPFHQTSYYGKMPPYRFVPYVLLSRTAAPRKSRRLQHSRHHGFIADDSTREAPYSPAPAAPSSPRTPPPPEAPAPPQNTRRLQHTRRHEFVTEGSTRTAPDSPAPAAPTQPRIPPPPLLQRATTPFLHRSPEQSHHLPLPPV